MSNPSESLLVVGGGITGLATAYIAARSGRKVTVLEGSPSFGGLLNTFEIGGNRLERFYHHFFLHDAEIQWLIRELGISDKLVFRKTRMGIYRDGKTHSFDGPGDLLRFSPIGFFDKLRFGFSSLFLGKLARWRDYEDVPAIDWFYRNAGKRATQAIWAPMLKVKFGKHANQVPLAWMVGRLRQRMNSRKGGDEQLAYLSGSLKTLLDALLDALREMDVELVDGAPVESLMIEGGKTVGVQCTQGEFRASQTVLTIPCPPIAKMIEPHDAALANRIGKVEYFGAICVILEMTQPLSDIYWLNVADEGFPFGGVIEHTNFVPASEYNGRHIAYLSRYFTRDEHIAQLTNAEAADEMLVALRKLYPNLNPASIAHVHVFKTNTAATVCDLNFSQKVVPAKLPIENLYLGNMMHIYPDERSVNNSIRVAAETCRVMGIDAAFVPTGQSLSGQLGF